MPKLTKANLKNHDYLMAISNQEQTLSEKIHQWYAGVEKKLKTEGTLL